MLMQLGTTIPVETSLMAIGLDSVAATELARTVGERFSIQVPSTLLFDHPTTSGVVRFIADVLCVASPKHDDRAVVVESIFPSREIAIPILPSSKMPWSALALEQGFSIMVPGPHFVNMGLKELATVGLVASQTAPISRWDTANTSHAHASAAYGAFVANSGASTDAAAFGISSLEA